MKVLFITPTLRAGGAERQLFELASQLLQKKFKVAVAIVTSGNDVYSERLANLGADCTTLKNRSKLSKLGELSAIVKKQKPDVLHGFMNIGCMFALPVSLWLRIPLVSSAIRDAKNQNWKYEVCYLLLSRTSQYFVSNSKAGFNCRYKQWRQNFRVIYNGMNLNRFSREFDSERVEGHYKIVMVASLSLHKDHETLFKAIASLTLKRFSITLQLIGDEPPTESGNLNRLMKLAESLDISSNVEFLGYQFDVESFINMADVSILLTNSRYHLEGLSNTIAESMALGKPVIATNSGGTPELIEDGVTGLLVADQDSDGVANAIEALLSNPDFSRELGRNGRQRILSEFGVERMTEDYIGLYES